MKLIEVEDVEKEALEYRKNYKFLEIFLTPDPQFAAKSCNHCHGTGIAGYRLRGTPVVDPDTGKSEYPHKDPIHCTCINIIVLKPEEKDDEA